MADKDLVTLLHKLAEVGKEINTVPKAGHNQSQNYDYACEADFKRQVRKPFYERGLVIIPEILDRQNYNTTNRDGKTMNYTDVLVKYTVYDSETGASISGSSAGSGFDSGDKAIYKALAGAMKYWLAQSNMIPTGDDPEYDGNGKTPQNNPQTPRNNQQNTQPAQNNNLSSAAQQGKIHTEAKRIGWSDDLLKTNIHQNYGVTSTKELSKAEASRYIEFLMKMEPIRQPVEN